MEQKSTLHTVRCNVFVDISSGMAVDEAERPSRRRSKSVSNGRANGRNPVLGKTNKRSPSWHSWSASSAEAFNQLKARSVRELTLLKRQVRTAINKREEFKLEALRREHEHRLIEDNAQRLLQLEARRLEATEMLHWINAAINVAAWLEGPSMFNPTRRGTHEFF